MALTKVSHSMISGAFVSVLDYGAVMNDSSSAQRTINKTALVAALSTGNTVTIPYGVLWIDGNIEFPENASLSGANATLTTIKGSGDLFKVTTGFGAGTFENLSIENDATLGKLYTVNTPQDTGQARFTNVNFGDATYHVYHATTFAVVNAAFVNCRFRGPALNSRFSKSAWAYKGPNCHNGYKGAAL